jgi:hypothetical protein
MQEIKTKLEIQKKIKGKKIVNSLEFLEIEAN